jgi:hypothetical protein
MSLKQYLTIMSIASVACIVAWIFVLLQIDPEHTTLIGYFFFYSTLFMSIVGTFSVAGFLVRQLLIKDAAIIFRHVKKTFRQSITIATLSIICLLFLQFNLLKWWNGLLLILLFIILEGMVFTNRKYSTTEYVSK